MKEFFQALNWQVIFEWQQEDEARIVRAQGRAFFPILDAAGREQFFRGLSKATEKRVLYKRIRGFDISIHETGWIVATPLSRWSSFLSRLAGEV